MSNLLTLEIAKDMLSYDPETGNLTWVKSPTNRIPAGSQAGSVNCHGYVFLKYKDRSYRAHRVAWLIHYGEWPKLQVDHINRNRADNRISNLRLATPSQNNANRSVSRTNRLRVKGVVFRKGVYCASLKSKGKRIHIGRFKTIEEAQAAYLDAAIREFGEYAALGGGDAKPT